MKNYNYYYILGIPLFYVMLYFVVMICLLSKVLLASSQECKDKFSECSDKGSSRDYPGTEEELKIFCEFHLNFQECIFNAAESCHRPDVADTAGQMLSNMRQVCNEGPLYRALVENLPCINPNLKPALSYCHPKKREGMEDFEKMLSNMGITEISHKDFRNECLHYSFVWSCLAAKLGDSCGEEVRDVAIEVIKIIFFSKRPCSEEIKEKFSVIVQAVELNKDS